MRCAMSKDGGEACVLSSLSEKTKADFAQFID